MNSVNRWHFKTGAKPQFLCRVGGGVNKGAQTSHQGEGIRGPIFNRSSPLFSAPASLGCLFAKFYAMRCIFSLSLQFPATLGNETCFLSLPFLSPVQSPHNFFGIKQRGVLLLPPGWDVSPSQDTQHKVTWSITTPS